MNRRLFQSLLVLFMIGLLAACGDKQENPDVAISTNETGEGEVPEDEIRITISLDNGAQFINEQQLKLEEDVNLVEIMKDTFFIETDKNNEITIIERQEASEENGTSWHLFINDEATDVSPKDYIPDGGERIVFDLH